MVVRTQADPLRSELPIILPDGRPAEHFLRLINSLFDNSRATVDDLDDKADKATQIIAGDGLTDGGPLSGDVTLNVGAGAGIIVNADDVAIDLTAETERIQDAIGAAVQDSSTIDATYSDPAGTITLDVKADSIGPTELTPTAVTPGTYGDATHVARVTIDQEGRVTGASEVAISASGSGSWIPAVTGAEPPVLLSDGAGHLILVAGP